MDALPHFSVATVGSVGSYKKGGGVLQKNWRFSLLTIHKNSQPGDSHASLRTASE